MQVYLSKLSFNHAVNVSLEVSSYILSSLHPMNQPLEKKVWNFT